MSTANGPVEQLRRNTFNFGSRPQEPLSGANIIKLSSSTLKRRNVKLGQDISERTMVKWVNLKLRDRKMHITTLGLGLNNGVALANLLEVLTGAKILSRGIKQNPRNFHEAGSNVHIIIAFIQNETSLKFPSLGVRDITGGRREPLMAIIFRLIRFYDPAWHEKYAHSENTQLTIEGAEEGLFTWLQAKLPGKAVTNIDKDWKNGSLIVELARSTGVKLPDLSGLSPVDCLRAVMAAADEQMGVPDILNAEDVYENKVDPDVMKAYLVGFRIANTEQSELDAERKQMLLDLMREEEREQRERRDSHSGNHPTRPLGNEQIGVWQTREQQLLAEQRRQEEVEALLRRSRESLKASDLVVSPTSAVAYSAKARTHQRRALARALRGEASPARPLSTAEEELELTEDMTPQKAVLAVVPGLPNPSGVAHASALAPGAEQYVLNSVDADLEPASDTASTISGSSHHRAHHNQVGVTPMSLGRQLPEPAWTTDLEADFGQLGLTQYADQAAFARLSKADQQKLLAQRLHSRGLKSPEQLHLVQQQLLRKSPGLLGLSSEQELASSRCLDSPLNFQEGDGSLYDVASATGHRIITSTPLRLGSGAVTTSASTTSLKLHELPGMAEYDAVGRDRALHGVGICTTRQGEILLPEYTDSVYDLAGTPGAPAEALYDAVGQSRAGSRKLGHHENQYDAVHGGANDDEDDDAEFVDMHGRVVRLSELEEALTEEPCGTCQKILVEGDRVIEAGLLAYHADCFRCYKSGIFLGKEQDIIVTEKGLLCMAEYRKDHTCAACNDLILESKIFVEALNKNYHKSCYCCSDCKVSFSTTDAFPVDDLLYCYEHALHRKMTQAKAQQTLAQQVQMAQKAQQAQQAKQAQQAQQPAKKFISV